MGEPLSMSTNDIPSLALESFIHCRGLALLKIPETMSFGILFLKFPIDDLKALNYYILANRAPALPGKNFKSLHQPSGHFTLYKGFRVWGRVGGVMLVLRTFPELVGRSVQNLVEIDLAVRA